MKKYLLLLWVALLGNTQIYLAQSGAAGEDFSALQSSGSYNRTGPVYTDKNLRQVSREKAVYVLDKELIGQDMAWNDSETHNYWEDRKYFKDTGIIRYFFKYRRIKDNKIDRVFAAVTKQGEAAYIFDTLGLTTYSDATDSKGDPRVHKKFNYSLGVLEGDLFEFSRTGDTLSISGYKKGKPYPYIITPKDTDSKLSGHWEVELRNNSNFSLDAYVLNLHDNGYATVGTETYYSEDMFGDRIRWKYSPLGSIFHPSGGAWRVKDQGGKKVLEIFQGGALLLSGEIRNANSSNLNLLVTDSKIEGMSRQEYTFKRSLGG